MENIKRSDEAKEIYIVCKVLRRGYNTIHYIEGGVSCLESKNTYTTFLCLHCILPLELITTTSYIAHVLGSSWREKHTYPLMENNLIWPFIWGALHLNMSSLPIFVTLDTSPSLVLHGLSTKNLKMEFRLKTEFLSER